MDLSYLSKKGFMFRNLLKTSLVLSQLLWCSSAFAGKQLIVTRESKPWMKTVFTDSLYGALVGGAGYGAYSLISKDFKVDTLGVSVGVGFFVCMIVGIVDASVTDSTALINYNKGTQQLALGVPQMSLDFKHSSGEFKVLDIRF